MPMGAASSSRAAEACPHVQLKHVHQPLPADGRIVAVAAHPAAPAAGGGTAVAAAATAGAMCVSVPKAVSDTPQGSLVMWRVVVLLGATSARARAGAAQGKLCGEDQERRHYGRTCQGLDKDLHSSTETENQMESRFLLDVVVTQSTAILKLLSSKDKTLLIRRDSFLVLDLSLDIVNGVRGLDVQRNGLAGESFYENLLKE